MFEDLVLGMVIPVHLLRRHPIPIVANFEFSLVLTYALPRHVLSPLLPPGLDLDSYDDFGFLAIALVQTRDLRPRGLPRFLAQDFFLSGYRIFARYRTRAGRVLRGQRILRSDTDRALMKCAGNALTHYRYQHSKIETLRDDDRVRVNVRTRSAIADLDVTADLASRPAPLPAGSPFPDLRTARRFAGPLPFTFDYEAETHSIIRIEGVRERWKPEPVVVDVREATFFHQPAFEGVTPILANAFYLEDVPYQWKRGIREPL